MVAASTSSMREVPSASLFVHSAARAAAVHVRAARMPAPSICMSLNVQLCQSMFFIAFGAIH